MKSIFTYTYKIIFVLIFCINTKQANAQVLAAGDIAFTGYISAGSTDEFSFVLLKNIPSGTTITFTDNSWLNTNIFRAGEETLVWTSSAAMLTGTEVKISGVGGSATIISSLGTCTGNMLSLSTSGDQVLAYQGTIASPTFISAIHMNVYQSTPPISDPVATDAATWDNTNSNNTTASSLPIGLTTGSTAIWVGTFQVSASEFDNAVFNCTGVPGTVAQIRAAVNNPANWTKSNGSPTAPVTVPSGCSFFTVTAINDIEFTAKLNTDKSATLHWKLQEKAGINNFVIEKSTDGISFKPLSTINVSSSTNGIYYYTDNVLLVQNTYYRLKITEQSGKLVYSNVVPLNVKLNTAITVFPNPVVNEFTIQQNGKNSSKTAVLTNLQGKKVMSISCVTNFQKINSESLKAGIYFLKMEDGSVFKLIKQ